MSTYTTTIHIPVTATGDGRDEAIGQLEQILADLNRSAAVHGASTGEPRIERLRPAARPVEGDCGHYRVTVGGVSAEETHYTSLAAAQAVADRLNTPAVTA